jgi:hypothetical protein
VSKEGTISSFYWADMSSFPPHDHNARFKYTEPPNPHWKYGEKIDATPFGKEWAKGEEEGWKHVDPATENLTYASHIYRDSRIYVNVRALYQLMTSGIVPRPIAFVSTISDDGVGNLAPFRYASSWYFRGCVNVHPAGLTW